MPYKNNIWKVKCYVFQISYSLIFMSSVFKIEVGFLLILVLQDKISSLKK